MSYLRLLFFLFLCPAVLAAEFNVNSELDMNDFDLTDGMCLSSMGTCTLRAAISQSNHTVALDVITLPAGHYPLSINGINDDANLTGDLDVLQPVHIIGAGRQEVIVDGLLLDRVLDIRVSGAVVIENLSLIHGVDGQPLGEKGAAIRNMPGAQLSINQVDVRDNGVEAFLISAAILQLGQLDAQHIRITDNTGHAIYVDGSITRLKRCLISGHNRLVIQIEGIDNFAKHELIEIESCSIINNYTVNDGIMFAGSHIENIYIVNTTVANNTGSYLFLNDNFSMMHFNNSTLYNNQIDTMAFTGSVNVDVHNLVAETSMYTNTIMANNGSNALSQVGIGGFLSLGGNYFSSIHKQLTQLPSDVIDPTEQVQLSQLSVVDDFSQVFYPMPESPLIDTGVNIGCTSSDQLGATRPIDGDGDAVAGCDVGAIEYSDLIFATGF